MHVVCVRDETQDKCGIVRLCTTRAVTRSRYFRRDASAFASASCTNASRPETGKSEYALPGLGRLAFVRDADAKHLVVCLASLVGKYVRDLVTARVVRHHKRTMPHLPMVSGYHDPVTNRFIADTDHVRRASGFPSDCFERRAVPGELLDEREAPSHDFSLDDLSPASLVDPASRV